MQGLRLQNYSSNERSRILFCYLMLFPILALFFVLRIFPIIGTFWMSLFDWSLIGNNRPFLGLGNYVMLFKDEQFLLSLKNTFLYAGASVIVCFVLSLPIAMVLAKKMRFSAFYQAIFFLPYITPLVPMSVAWKWISIPCMEF